MSSDWECRQCGDRNSSAFDMCACKFFRELPRRSEPLGRPADDASTPLLSFAGSSFWPQHHQQHPAQSGQWFWSSAQPPGFPQSSGWFIPVAHAPPPAASFAGPSSFATSTSSTASSGGDGLLAQVVLQTQQIARLKAELNAAKALAVAAAVETKKLDDSASDSDSDDDDEQINSAPTVPGIDGVVTSPTMSYRIRQHLGESACGTMVACVDHFGHSYVGKLVPVARAHISSGGQWRRETEQLRRLHHPNVVQLFEAFDDHGVFWLLYECTSYALDALLQRMVMTELDVLHAVGHIVAALDYCHVRHIVHGDLHADNVLVSYSQQQQPHQLVDHRGRPFVLKLADVGVAALLNPDADAVLPAAVGRAYDLPPERVGAGYVCQQSDLYQLGLLVYLMYRRQPALGPADGAPIAAIQSGAARVRAECIGTELGMVVSVLLRRTPSFRYQTTRDLWDAVEPIFARPEARVPVAGELPPTKYPHLLFHTASQLAARPESERAFE